MRGPNTASGYAVGRAIALMALACLAVSACETPGMTPQTLGTDPPTPSSRPDGSTTTSEQPRATDEDTPEGPPPVVVTGTGIPLVVTGEAGEGFFVLTPCGNDGYVVDAEPVYEADVVLDPGHGGQADTGAVGSNGLSEKELNLDLARRTAELLSREGIEAVVTRGGDHPSRLFVRSALADALGARALVSIHHNAPTPPPAAVPGTEVYTQLGSLESRRLGGLLWESVTGSLRAFDVDWAAADDAGVLTVANSEGFDAYGMLRHPETTAVLVELGYLSNPSEAELFATETYREVAAGALAAGIEAYLRTDATGSGFGEGRVFNPAPGISGEACIDPELG